MSTQGEPVGTCGCRLIRTDTGLTMQDCPLHAQAEAMRDLIHRARFSGHDPLCRAWMNKPSPKSVHCLACDARALLRAMEGKETT